MIFAHSGCVGDIIASLPTVKALLARAGLDQGSLLLRLGVPARYPANAKHPLGNVRLDHAFAARLLPLLALQPYLGSVGLWDDGQPVDVDLDDFRTTGFNYSAGSLARYYCHVWPICPVLWQPWISVDPDPAFAGCILVNRTARYHHPGLSYSFLAGYRNIRFIGLPEEYRAFRAAFRLPGLVYSPTADYLAAARAIAGCRLFIGNQSACFWLAEGIKAVRVLEVCPATPNVSPCGPGGYEVYSQPLLEEVVAELAASRA